MRLSRPLLGPWLISMDKNETMKAEIGILAASYQLPKGIRLVEELFRDEKAEHSPETTRRLGIKQVHLQNGAASETVLQMH